MQLVVLRQADDDIRLRDALLRQQVDVRSVAADRKPRRQLFCEHLTALAVLVDHLYLHALPFEHERERTPCASRADDRRTRQFVRVALHEALAELLNAVGQPDEVGVVARQEYVVAVRDNHAVIAEDQPCEDAVRQLQTFQRRARNGGAAADARLEKAHLALREILHIERGGRHEDAIDFVCRNEFGIEHEVNVKIFLEIAPRLYGEIHVTDACDRVRNAVLLCEYAGDNVHLVALRHSDEDVRTLDVGVVHRERACDIRLDRQHVEHRLCRLKLALLAVHHDDIHALLREQRRNTVAQPPRTCDYDPHNESLLRILNEI